MARQSTFSLFKRADMEGYLEKLGSGITSKLIAGRTRLWCELYGTELHLFKDSKRSSSGIQQMDMKQVHMVRKASSDKTGHQFEILCKTKCQTFCASSVEECNTWIKHLQRAMTLKDQDPAPLDTSCVSVGDYEIVEILPEDASKVPHFVMKQSSASESDSGYTDIEFCSTSSQPTVQTSTTDSKRIPAQTKQSYGAKEEDGYSSVEVVMRNGSGQPVVQEVTTVRGSLDSHSTDPSSQGDNIKDVYAKVMKPKRDTNPSQPQTVRTETEGYEEDSYGYAKVNQQTAPPPVPSAPAAESGEISTEELRTVGDGASDDTSDEDDVYVNIISKESPDPIPKFPHPLKQDDLEPLAILQEFLSNNRKVCRRSFFDNTVGDDPVGDMKKLLLEMQV